MKKTILLVVAVISLGFAGYQFAFARPMGMGWMGGGDCWNCDRNWACAPGGQLDEKTMQAREKFLTETTELRKQLAVKQAEAAALMNGENPDAKKIGRLAGEIFDLRNQLHEKAKAHGLQTGSGCRTGMGPGMMHGPMPGYRGQMGN